MPFLAPLAIPAITAGLGIGASALTSKIAGGTPQASQDVLNLTSQAQRAGMDLSGKLLPQGQSLLTTANNAYNPVINYWSSLLSGNRGAATSMLGPDISRIGEGYAAAGRTSAALNPRSGPSAAYMANLPFQQQRDVTQLLQTARPQAAAGLLQAGQTAGAQGDTLVSNSINALNGSTTAGRGILDYQLQKTQQDRALGSTIGGGIFQLLKGINFGGFGKSGGGSKTSNLPSAPWEDDG